LKPRNPESFQKDGRGNWNRCDKCGKREFVKKIKPGQYVCENPVCREKGGSVFHEFYKGRR
jgi:hypothetical protein